MRGTILASALLLAATLSGCASGAEGAADDPRAAAGTSPAATSTTGSPPTPHPDLPSSATASPPPAAPPSGNGTAAGNATLPRPGPVVAILDTGILASHAAFRSGQLVAWYDFAAEGGPEAPDVLWDHRKAPYDEDGHGTAVASLVAGTDPRLTPSHAPGASLAVAKIAGPDGSASWEDAARALRWATDVVHADVISLSFYAYRPQTGGGHPLLEALELARSKGAFPVVLAGNGFDNRGVPTESWLHPPATSLHALVVGGASADGEPVAPLGSLDPEVTALYTVTAACPEDEACSDEMGGTSFSTPLAAGLAARILREADGAGLPRPTADRLERLLKLSSRDTQAPPNLEGYGFLDAAQLGVALDSLRSGTDPPRPSPDASALWVETVQEQERRLWSQI